MFSYMCGISLVTFRMASDLGGMKAGNKKETLKRVISK